MSTKLILNKKDGYINNVLSNTDNNSVFTCISYAEARLSYRLDVCLSVRLSVRHTLVLCQNGSTYRQTVFTSIARKGLKIDRYMPRCV